MKKNFRHYVKKSLKHEYKAWRHHTRRRLAWLLALIVWLIVLVGNGERLYAWYVGENDYMPLVREKALKYGLDPNFVRSVIWEESKFAPDAVGRAGEIGLMQVLPTGAVADWARVNRRREPGLSELFKVELNLEIGCWYLARAKRRWSGYKEQRVLALCQYNAGERRAQEWKPETPEGSMEGRIAFDSTRRYVHNIMRRYRRYDSE